jgi:CBS domain-containing protein
VAANVNLSLEFEEPDERSPKGRAAGTARIFVESACSYLKESGAPVISLDCHSAADFAAEAERLKGEIDSALQEAQRRFQGRAGEEQPAAAPSARATAAAPTPKHPLSIREDLRVRDRMTRDVKTLKPNDRITVAEELMKVGSFRHVVVVSDDETEVVGVLSQNDICFNALAWNLGEGRAAHDRILGELPVKQVMRGTVTSVSPDALLSDAARTMIESKIGCLPVVEHDQLVGILTAGDFLAMLTDASYDQSAPADDA